MIKQKHFVITIGDTQTLIALHFDDEIKYQIYVENLEEKKEEIKKVFSANKACPIYVLLDTVDQSYKKKTYPLIKKFDLLQLIKRDLASDADKESFKNYIILNKEKEAKQIKKWECLFISCANTALVTMWVDFILELDNHFIGIYMLPVESTSFFLSLKNIIKSESKIKGEKSDIYFIIMQNKTGGVRQMVFSNDKIIFTRVVNYDFLDENFATKYEQDLHSTFEYLKRIFVDISLAKFDIINIFSQDIISKITKINNIEFNFINHTPFEIASQIGYRNLIEQKESCSDLLLSKSFVKNKKKILKFITPKISYFNRLFIFIRISHYIGLLFLLTIALSGFIFINNNRNHEEELSLTETQKLAAFQELSRLKSTTFSGEILDDQQNVVDLDRIIDLGKIYENLNDFSNDYIKIYEDLKFIKSYGMRLTGYSYSLNNFNYKSPAITNYKITLNGAIANKNGDIEDLLRNFDSLTADIQKKFNKQRVSYVELPKNIDFTKKYYDFPVEFSITK